MKLYAGLFLTMCTKTARAMFFQSVKAFVLLVAFSSDGKSHTGLCEELIKLFYFTKFD